jgi:cellulose synthase/poly-beta-1,6-N-acetylglucosamine synthase-like glycosyltransferase
MRAALAPSRRTSGTTANTVASRGRERNSFLVSLMTRPQKAAYVSAYLLWLASLVYFWSWWLDPAHNVGTVRFLTVSALVALTMAMPLYTLTIFLRSRVPAPGISLSATRRVAMVVTKAPSEPFSIIAETLTAMCAQDLRHDTWLADEDPSEETLAWCRAHSVFVSTRKGRDDYHRPQWPRRTRCKEGNLAFFYDNYGYDRYDFVAQLDADHVPSPSYLRHMLAPFCDPRVGYVSAPSICDRNAANSWSARSRLYAEGILHGALQAGYNGGWAPICFGSHYAVRTAALKDIGGLGPELAEDHSTTLMMNARGWRGAHAIDAIANGDGPQTFADLATQEFQWSRSIMTLLIKYTPDYIGKLPLKLRFQFLFCQLWYGLFCTTMALSFSIPIVALLFDMNFVGTDFPQFFKHLLPSTIILTSINTLFRANGWWRPTYAKVFSWEGVLFPFARWPWALAGILAAFRDWATGTFVDFRVTPKGAAPTDVLPFRIIVPYAALSIASALPAILVDNVTAGRGFYFFAIFNAIVYALILVVIILRHAYENSLSPNVGLIRQSAFAAVVSTISVVSLSAHGLEGLDTMAAGAEPLKLTRLTYGPSGAGLTAVKAGKLRFEIWWDSQAETLGNKGNLP